MACDLAILGGTVYDGTGRPGVHKDVGIRDGRVAIVGRVRPSEASEVIRAEGKVVTPGFIDIHTHSDLNILVCPAADNALGQGVTTEVVGNCGSLPAPAIGMTRREVRKRLSLIGGEVTWRTFAEWARAVQDVRPAINLAPLVGHGDLRAAVMGYDKRAAEARELEDMATHLTEALDAGAFGLSTGLIYAPSCYAPREEIVALAGIVGRRGGLYASHIRGEGVTLLPAVQEALATAKEAGVPLEISHHKATGPRNWGKTRQTLALVDAALVEGQRVGMDMYPYTATATGLAALVPPAALEGGPEALVDRLGSRSERDRLRTAIEGDLDSWENIAGEAGWDAVVFSGSDTGRNRPLQGKSLRQIARLRRKDPVEVLFDLLVEEEGGGDIICHEVDEGDVARVYRHPMTVVGSDGWTASSKGPLAAKGVHPRAFGTFPRFLHRFVMGKRLLSWPQAVRKMTGQPGERVGLRDRGLVKPGMWADLVVLDPRTLRDQATYGNPKRPARGLDCVLVNGEVVARRGRPTGARPGRVLRR